MNTMFSGNRIGPFEILAAIGAGGMGEVYRARDTRLDREVAIKILPEAFAHDPERMARFKREAQVLASLNHPNIATIHGLEESGDVRALVMELVEGPTLADRIAQGSIPVAEALALARQIAEGLEYAHEKGVVHRDLKPANIKIKPDGTVKLLDFGLAKAVEEPCVPGNASVSPTVTIQGTRPGVILGTAAYMSPEQASGKIVDRRSDIWSFGVVLWEMLTGERLFNGETLSHTLADVLRAPIHFDRLGNQAPAAIQNLLRRCLDRDARNRLRDIGEARVAIQSFLAKGAGNTEAAAPHGSRSRPGWLWPAASAVLLLAFAALSFVHFARGPAPAEVVRFEVAPPQNSEFTCCLSLSPDGRKIAFTAQRRTDTRPSLWVRSLDATEAKIVYQNFTGGPGAPHPFFSPDSRFVAFNANGKIRRVDLIEGTAQTICDTLPGFTGGAWSPRDEIIIGGSSSGLMRVSATGGQPSPLTELDRNPQESEHGGPAILPDGKHFIYLRRAPESSGLYVGSLDVAPSQQNRRLLLATNVPAVYSATPDTGNGRILFLRENTLMAQLFDPAKLVLEGDPRPVVESVDVAQGRGVFAASATGALIYRTSSGQANHRSLTWLNRQGKVLGRLGDLADYAGTPALAPDGTHVAIMRGSATPPGIWLLDSRGVSSRLTFDPAPDLYPLWSPDGTRIVFSSKRAGHYDLYQKPANGAGEDTLLLKSDEDKTPTGWSRDGHFLIFSSLNPKTGRDLWLLPEPFGAQADRHPVPMLHTEFYEGSGTLSPDMRWYAYVSNESGQYHVYVRPFTASGSAASPGRPAATGKWQVSKEVAALALPRWRANGNELLFEGLHDMNRYIMSVGLKLNPAFQAGTPQSLFQLPPGTSSGWDVTPDGKRFLVNMREWAGDSAPQTISVVLNFAARLR